MTEQRTDVSVSHVLRELADRHSAVTLEEADDRQIDRVEGAAAAIGGRLRGLTDRSFSHVSPSIARLLPSD